MKLHQALEQYTPKRLGKDGMTDEFGNRCAIGAYVFLVAPDIDLRDDEKAFKKAEENFGDLTTEIWRKNDNLDYWDPEYKGLNIDETQKKRYEDMLAWAKKENI